MGRTQRHGHPACQGEKTTLQACCHDAILHGKCNYTYISNTISMYAKPAPEPVDRTASSLKSVNKDAVVTGVYKDDDDKYCILRRPTATGAVANGS